MTTAVPATARALDVSPLFLVPDVVRAAEYYRDRLGFTVTSYYGDPPCFIIVHRDRVYLMLKLAEAPGGTRPNGAQGAWDAYLWFNDLDALREELVSRGANVLGAIRTTPYGTRELEVEDADAYRLCFAQDVPAIG